MPKKPAHRSVLVELPETPYPEAMALQEQLVTEKVDGGREEDILLLLEHPPVFTLGRRGGKSFLRVSEDWLRKQQIDVVPTDRGGFITYHGPGQIVGYPVFDLQRMNIGVADLVEHLEEVMIRTAAHWGVKAVRDPANRGIWAGGRKLGSIGLAVRRGISFHGFALNGNMDLAPFEWITPCGIADVAMTSLAREQKAPVEMAALRRVVRQAFGSVFGLQLSIETSAILPSAAAETASGAL